MGLQCNLQTAELFLGPQTAAQTLRGTMFTSLAWNGKVSLTNRLPVYSTPIFPDLVSDSKFLSAADLDHSGHYWRVWSRPQA